MFAKNSLSKSILLKAASGSIAILIAGIATIIGLSPDKIVGRIFGSENVKAFANMVMADSTPENIRWYFVIVGDLAFFVGTLCFAMIPATIAIFKSKAYQNNLTNVQNEFNNYKEWNEAEHKKIDANILRERAEAAKKLRSSRRLHEKTRLMLQEIRRHKTPDL